MTQENEFTLSVHSSKVKSQSTNNGITALTIDLSDGWGHACTLFLDAALRVAGKQELRGQLCDFQQYLRYIRMGVNCDTGAFS